MDEREKICILCGAREVMPGYICTACQERIQQEVVDQRENMRQAASNPGDAPDRERNKG